MANTKTNRTQCVIMAGGIDATTINDSYPLSRAGWAAAHKSALEARERLGAGYATLICPVKDSYPAIPLYQCYRGESCTIEGQGATNTTVLAGSRRRKQRRR